MWTTVAENGRTCNCLSLRMGILCRCLWYVHIVLHFCLTCVMKLNWRFSTRILWRFLELKVGISLRPPLCKISSGYENWYWRMWYHPDSVIYTCKHALIETWVKPTYLHNNAIDLITVGLRILPALDHIPTALELHVVFASTQAWCVA